MSSKILCASVLGLVVGCGEGAVTALDAGTSAVDASAATPADAASGSSDAESAPSDAGMLADAEASVDAGAERDAGEPAALEPGDPGFVRAWFAGYNEGQGTSYLAAPFTDNPGGDPRYAAAPAHRHLEGVAYGPYPRNTLDAWLLDGDDPEPVVVFIHGGGFVGGTRDSLHANLNTITRLLEAGIAVVAISYRWAYRDPEAAVNAPRPNDEGTVHDDNGARLDYILRDCARSIQFIRHRAADWGVDASRIAVYGGSAGAGCATWIGGVEDLAEPEHDDPVLRQSTRVQAVGHLNGQPTYAWSRWPELLRLDAEFVFSYVEDEAVRLTQMPVEDLTTTEQGRGLDYVLDYYEHLGPGDAALFSQNQNPDLDETMITEATQVIHHPRAHVALYERCVQAGGDCGLRTRDRNEGPDRDLLSFVARILQP